VRDGSPRIDAIALDELSLGSKPKDRNVKANLRLISSLRLESKFKSVFESFEVSLSYRTTKNTCGFSGFLFKGSTLLAIERSISSCFILGLISNAATDRKRLK
jgi:hypothetical protein